MKNESEIRRTKRAGRQFSESIATAKIFKKQELGSKIAVIIPGSLCSSVKRNRTRRIFFEAFREVIDVLPYSVDVIVYPKAIAIQKGKNEARSFLERALGI